MALHEHCVVTSCRLPPSGLLTKIDFTREMRLLEKPTKHGHLASPHFYLEAMPQLTGVFEQEGTKHKVNCPCLDLYVTLGTYSIFFSGRLCGWNSARVFFGY
ncbi:hypothetical protein JTE90_008476 [Oedothorax gibbosus]|uniref:Uncharacterized protein n=1 Tax=Oedothorax gibbosus TaxID=931172 RepID=A0AAV6V144_9ARAC|nr:hypothetical protein JTE90_008476 [Oedothorax gibbosus]